MKIEQKFGVYFYTWYCEQKWLEHDKQFMPLIGEYDSRDPAVIEWQIEQLARSGIDYVIFEYVPHQDWASKISEEAITKKITGLKAKNIKTSFLLDASLLPEKGDLLLEFKLLKKYLHKIGIDQLQKGPQGLPVLFIYGASADSLKKIKEKYVSQLEIYSVLSAPTKHIAENVSLPDHIPFWQETADLLALNKFATVTPGYDDLLLKRKPQVAPVVPRENGDTYIQQFKKAIDSQAEHIIIYGWNEYFKSTNIEPTVEYGHYYVDLTRKLIDDARAS